MVVDSLLPPAFAITVRFFTDAHLAEQVRRKSADTDTNGKQQREACLEVLWAEQARRAAGKRRPTYEELQLRRAERRAKKS